MAISLRCPKCEATLRIAQSPASGQKVECPKCGTNFRPPIEDEEPRRPAAQSRDDDDDRPRKSKQTRSDDEDRPVRKAPAKSRREDDDDDDRPARKPWKSQQDDEDDDDRPSRRRKPAGRSRRDDDDDDDYRRPHKKKQESNPGLVIGLVAGGTLIALLAVGGIVYAVISGGGRDNDNNVVANVQQPAVNAQPVNNANTNEAPAGGANEAPAGGANTNTTKDAGAGTTVGGVTGAAMPPPGNTGAAIRPSGPAPKELPADIEAKIRKATVYVEVTFETLRASGSGFVVRSSDDAAYVVTNNHVIAPPDEKEKEPAGPGPGGRPGIGGPPRMMPPRIGPPRIGMGPGRRPDPKPEPKRTDPDIIVMLYRGTPQETTLEAKVVATDPEADLAVLRIGGGRNYPAPIELAAEADLVEFAPVRIFGFPKARKDLLMSNAVASQLVRNTFGELTDVQLNINSEVTHGSSGGPVVDTLGRVIGVTVAGINEKNVGWAVPATKLTHMFRGSVNGGLLYQIRQKGIAVGANGEVWRLDRQGRVDSRKALDLVLDPNAPNQELPPNEYHVVALMSDPLKKISSVQLHYSVKRADSVVKNGDGFGPLRNAQKVEMSLTERSAKAVIKLDGAADDVYLAQFVYVNGDGKTIHTEPNEFRFTFPESVKTASIVVIGVKDEAGKRYVGELLRSLMTGSHKISTTTTPNGLNATVEPVEDPKALAAKVTFGKATVTGWQITVVVDKLDLPKPTTEEVDKAVADLKSSENRVRQAAADRLAKCYAPLPERQKEVATLLAAQAVGEEFWAGMAANNALKIWSIPENVPVLAAYLEKEEKGIDQRRGGIVAIVIKYKDPAAAKALANCLSSGFHRGNAAAALKAIGPAAEKAVIPVLEHKDSWTVREACMILKEIGTKESIAPLQALIDKKPDFLIAPEAKNALEAVKNRN